MKAFRITGTFRMGKKIQSFTKEVACDKKENATELILSDLGSRHKVKRPDITIDTIDEIKPDDISDTVVAFKVGGMRQ
jgi:large subunit ribosomal protein LX